MSLEKIQLLYVVEPLLASAVSSYTHILWRGTLPWFLMVSLLKKVFLALRALHQGTRLLHLWWPLTVHVIAWRPFPLGNLRDLVTDLGSPARSSNNTPISPIDVFIPQKKGRLFASHLWTEGSVKAAPCV